MEDFKTRLKKARQALGLSQNAAAKKGGVAQHNWNRYESGAIEAPPYTFIEALSKLGINANWLLTGVGEMLNAAPTHKGGGVHIPLVALAGAGTFEVDTPLPQEDVEEMVLPPSILLPKSPLYMIKVCGDSMMDEYHDGDHLIVTPEERPKKGRPYVFVADGQTWLKNFNPLPSGEVELTSTNGVNPIAVKKKLQAFKLLYHLRKPKRL